MTLFVQFNGDTGNNYEWIERFWNQVPGQNTNSAVATSEILVSTEGDFQQRRAAGYALIADYLSTAKQKALRAGGFSPFTNNRLQLNIAGGKWVTSTDPITSLRFFLTPPRAFQIGSVVSIYGINAIAS